MVKDRQQTGSSDPQNPSTILRQKGTGPGGGGCTLIEINIDGQLSYECRGSCGLINRFLGRSCNVIRKPVGSVQQVYCTCSGGWWDNIFS
jgi:hypothetical protein